MKKIKLLFTAFLLIFSINLYSQDTEIEKLLKQGDEISYKNLDSSLIIFEKALELSKESKSKKYEAKSLGQIGRTYYYKNETEIASKYFQDSYKIAVEIKDYQQIIKMCNNLGLLKQYTQKYDQAFMYFTKQLKYSMESGDSLSISDAYNNIGSYYMNIDNKDSSVFYFNLALNTAKKIDYKMNIATINTNLAIIYHTKGNFPFALKYNQEAAKIFEEIKDYRNLSITIGNIGALYLDNEKHDKAEEYLLQAYGMKDTIVIEDYYKQTHLINLSIIYLKSEKLEKAEKFLSEALEICKKNDDIKSQIVIYLNYASLYLQKDDKPKALEYGKLALQYAEDINSELYIASSNKRLGQIYNEMKNYSKAIECLKIAYQKSVELEYLTYILDVLSELKNSYTQTKDYKNAFETCEKIIVFKDSLTGIETQKQLSTLETIYETEKKEQEIERQKLQITAKNLKIKQGNIVIISVSAISVLLIFLSFVLIKSIKSKKKANKILAHQKKIIEEKNEELNQLVEEVTTQKEEIEQQRDLANEQKEEILSSINYAQRIQKAVLPSDELLTEILPEHFVLFKPRDVVSGDFYWMKQIKNFIVVAAADCTGHGVPGAFMSMLGSSFLNEIVTGRSLDNSGEILNKLRDKVKKSLHQKGKEGEQKDGMDIAFYIIDTETLELQFSGAYNPLYIIRKSKDPEGFENPQGLPELIELKANRQPIAVHIKESPFDSQKFKLQKGDCLYSFSDGFPDQFGGDKGSKYKTKNFKQLLSSISNESMKIQKQKLETEFKNWKGTEYEQIDDVLVIGIKI